MNPPPTLKYGSFVYRVNPSDRELAADATLSQGGNFASVTVDWFSSGVRRPARSPHLQGRLPAGCNIVFLDGHADWRKFKDMSIRTWVGSDFWY